jgi:hypothetical protein
MSDRAPDLIQPVIGFRLWRLDEGALWSLYADERWGRGRQTARCLAPDGPQHTGPSPAHFCTCGIYAWYRTCPRLASAGTPELVGGAVVLWGRMELHPTGMRAEQAMVVALALPFSRRAKRARILDVAAALEVEAVPARHLAAAAGQYGAPVPRELKPGQLHDRRAASARRGAGGGWVGGRSATGQPGWWPG